MLSRCSNGFGALALAALMNDDSWGAAAATTPRTTHFVPQAKSVIFLYQDGGVSQVDTFDPKPRLNREEGQTFGMETEPTQFDNIGKSLGGRWPFRHYGESGIPVSDLFAHVGSCADDLAVVRSVVSNFAEHNAANYFLHSGFGISGRPSMGAWATYGLGNANQDLPAFVVINAGHIPAGGIDCFGSGFLPATYQASILRKEPPLIANIAPLEVRRIQRSKLMLMKRLDGLASERMGAHDALESAIRNYELAFRMQSAVPSLADLSSETESTRQLYGLDDPNPPTRNYARQCLMARRLVEQGVRFVELTCPRVGGIDRWDAHTKLRRNHAANARAMDRPTAGLLKDLKSRGLLEETLVVWAGEFGRTPFAQGRDGRDHNPFGYTIWMAGGGIRGGTVYGATDEYGYKAVENPVTIYDLHATMLHVLGFDHTKLTFRYSGRDMRLTDVHGHVIFDILA